MKILIRTPLSSFSGYGRDGIGLVRAMLRAGHDVRIMPQGAQPPLPVEVADLFTKGAEGPFDLVLSHCDPSASFITQVEKRLCDVRALWTMWEWTSLRAWKGVHKNLRAQFPVLTDIVGYDEVSLMALRDAGAPRRMRFHKALGGYDPELWQGGNPMRDGQPFRFAMVGDLAARKDPATVIGAFAELKREMGSEFADAELHLKPMNPHTIPPFLVDEIPRLKIHLGSWDSTMLRDFYCGINVLLVSSRGEGKHLPSLEIMTTGGTVIAPEWGGIAEWMDEEIAYPLKYEQRPMPGKPGALFAAVDKDHLKEVMWHTYTHRDEVLMKGDLASQVIPQRHSWDAAVGNMLGSLGLG